MTITYKPIKSEEFVPNKRRKNGIAATVINGFINSGEPMALVQQNGETLNYDNSTRKERSRVHSSLAGYCERHNSSVKLVSGENGVLCLRRTDVEG